jgi:uncharacterized membrane protein YphA (DoxX/SURF4 family)
LTAQLTVRMLIASYFMAASIGSVPGAIPARCWHRLMDDPLSRVIGGSIVFTLATMVLLGVQTRIAALGLGLITFYASYLHMVQIGIDHVLGAFWRDMALVAMLMLTYGGTAKAPAAARARQLHDPPRRAPGGTCAPDGRPASAHRGPDACGARCQPRPRRSRGCTGRPPHLISPDGRRRDLSPRRPRTIPPP